MNKEQINKLHKLLVKTSIDFLIKENIEDIDMISFQVDGLIDGIEYKEWTPSMDSYLGCYDDSSNLKIESL